MVRPNTAGYTLLELTLWMGIVAVLATIVISAGAGLRRVTDEVAYKEETTRIQAAVDTYMIQPGQKAWPIKGRSGLGTLEQPDADNIEETIIADLRDPRGGRDGGTPQWVDTTPEDGFRTKPDEETLYDEDVLATSVGWRVDTVKSQGTDYLRDTRDYFINFSLLTPVYLRTNPSSASADNVLLGKGSYSWYIDSDGLVRSLLAEFPTKDYKGYQEVFP